jgi:hypothetical protein
MKELPTIKTCWTHAHFIGLLDEHETHAKVQCAIWKDIKSVNGELTYEYWRGRLETIQALKGEVK